MKDTHKHPYICPAERAGLLDTSLRKLLQDPQKILKPFIKEGMTVLDVGCGPGYFSVEIAKMLNGSGKVIAADLQEGMLNMIRKKISGTPLEQRIELHKSNFESIGVTEKVDFILAFWMVHEVRNQDKFFAELYSVLKPNGLIFIVEPKFHVSKREFRTIVEKAKENRFTVVTGRISTDSMVREASPTTGSLTASLTDISADSTSSLTASLNDISASLNDHHHHHASYLSSHPEKDSARLEKNKEYPVFFSRTVLLAK